MTENAPKNRRTSPPNRSGESPSPVLSVVIVNYNVKEFLEQALISIRKALKNNSSEIIVVDNASSDGSVEMIREQFPDVLLIENKTNFGFAKSSNQGIEMSSGQVVILINPDTIVQEDTFQKTLSYLAANPEAGVVGCKILNPDGSLQLACRRSFPTPWVAFTKLSGLSRVFSKSKLFGRYNLTYLDADKTCEVEAISGSFMAVRAETIKQVGLLDEAFFMYGEDLDWCYRIGQSGWKVVYYPGTQIIHFKGESSKKAKFDSLRTFYQAMGLFAQKHFRRRYLLMPYWFLWVAIWLRASVSFFGSFLKSTAVSIADLAVIFISMLTGIYLRFGDFSNINAFVPVMLAYSIVWMAALKLFGAHNRNRFSSSSAGVAIFVGFLINASLTFFFKQYAFSRAFVLITGAISLLVVPGWRLFLKIFSGMGLISFQGTLGKTLLARNTIVVGDIASAAKLIQKLQMQVDSGYDIRGFVSTNGRCTEKAINGVPILGDVDEIDSLILAGNIQEVIFSTHQLSYDRILRIISRSGNQNVNFKLIPNTLDVVLGKASIDRLNDVPLVEIDYRLHQKHFRFLKRLTDIALASSVITITVPLFFLKKYLSSKPVSVKRLQGVHGTFAVREFSNSKKDYIRKLPYLFNIVNGEMSFVGSEIREVPEGVYSLAKPAVDLKPGLTGLAQVNSRKHLTEEDKEKYQIYYLKNYSPLLDLEIIFKALFRI